jgi:hypothetical protein
LVSQSDMANLYQEVLVNQLDMANPHQEGLASRARMGLVPTVKLDLEATNHPGASKFGK